MFGRTSNFGATQGAYDAGKASWGQLAWAGGQWGLAMGYQGFTLGDSLVAKPFAPYYKYYNPESPSKLGPWLTRGYFGAPYGRNFDAARSALSLPLRPTGVERVRVPILEWVRGPGVVESNFGQPGGGLEWFRPFFRG